MTTKENSTDSKPEFRVRFLNHTRFVLTAGSLMMTGLFLASCTTGNSGNTQQAEVTKSADPEAWFNQQHFNLENGIALSGYDPVSYFDGKPEMGAKEWRFTYNGISYQFINETNLKKFESDPLSFEPAFGGWCAWAVVDGDKVEIDPETYRIQDGRLLLFYNGIWGNTLESWNDGDVNTLLSNADVEWENITAE